LFSVGGTVTEIDPIARHMRRIRIEGDDLARLTWIPGQHVRVHVADLLDPRSWLRPRDFLRTYSVWQHDDGIELRVLDHDTGGPGARWARQLRPGQDVSFSRPEGSFVLRDGRYHRQARP
jgi:NADPH-dependent ferric siderophore reductase